MFFLKKKKILVIDDEPSILDILEMLLDAEGYQVIKSNNGELGLELAKQHKPHLIVLDVMMPKMSGYMVANVLGKDTKLNQIPILLLTATSQVTGNILMKAPTEHRLTKPFKPEELVEKVHTIIASDELNRQKYITQDVCP